MRTERSHAAPAPRVGALSPGRRRVARQSGRQAELSPASWPTARLLSATWNPDGRSVLYLNVPPDPHKLRNIREFTPDTNEDKAISDTTQYACFERNADGSVFVGASGSKASPYVLLLVRAVQREFTLCEHRSSDPARVSPIFSPNSQNVFFSSDQHGKPAIYRIAVDKLVEATEESPAAE